MFKIKYQFDSNTLKFKKVKLVWKQKLARLFGFLTITGFTAIVLHIAFTAFYKTPKEIGILEERNNLLTKYDMINDQMREVELIAKDMQQRDDYFYRTIFELEPIPASIREAGFGGVNRYINYEGYENTDLLISSFSKLDALSKQLYVQSKSFDTVIELARNKEKMIASIPAIQPLALKDFTRISDYFGSRQDPFTGLNTMHHGMDFTGPEGADVFATGDGIVVEAGYSFHGYGNRIIIDHGYGYKTVYAHLEEIVINEGDKVKRGDVIGKLGNTGRSTGVHLHYEVKLHDQTIDPINYYFNDMTEEEYDLMVEACSKRRTPMD